MQKIMQQKTQMATQLYILQVSTVKIGKVCCTGCFSPIPSSIFPSKILTTAVIMSLKSSTMLSILQLCQLFTGKRFY